MTFLTHTHTGAYLLYRIHETNKQTNRRCANKNTHGSATNVAIVNINKNLKTFEPQNMATQVKWINNNNNKNCFFLFQIKQF